MNIRERVDTGRPSPVTTILICVMLLLLAGWLFQYTASQEDRGSVDVQLYTRGDKWLIPKNLKILALPSEGAKLDLDQVIEIYFYNSRQDTNYTYQYGDQVIPIEFGQRSYNLTGRDLPGNKTLYVYDENHLVFERQYHYDAYGFPSLEDDSDAIPYIEHITNDPDLKYNPPLLTDSYAWARNSARVMLVTVFVIGLVFALAAFVTRNMRLYGASGYVHAFPFVVGVILNLAFVESILVNTWTPVPIVRLEVLLFPFFLGLFTGFYGALNRKGTVIHGHEDWPNKSTTVIRPYTHGGQWCASDHSLELGLRRVFLGYHSPLTCQLPNKDGCMITFSYSRLKQSDLVNRDSNSVCGLLDADEFEIRYTKPLRGMGLRGRIASALTPVQQEFILQPSQVHFLGLNQAIWRRDAIRALNIALVSSEHKAFENAKYASLIGVNIFGRRLGEMVTSELQLPREDPLVQAVWGLPQKPPNSDDEKIESREEPANDGPDA